MPKQVFDSSGIGHSELLTGQKLGRTGTGLPQKSAMLCDLHLFKKAILAMPAVARKEA